MQSEWGGKCPLAEAGRSWHGLDWPALSEDFFLLNNFQKLFLHSTTEQQGLHRPWWGPWRPQSRMCSLTKRHSSGLGVAWWGMQGAWWGSERKRKGRERRERKGEQGGEEKNEEEEEERQKRGRKDKEGEGSLSQP